MQTAHKHLPGPTRTTKILQFQYSTRLEVMTENSLMIGVCEKRQSLFGSISISHYFISVYLAEEGLQYLSTYKSTLHPEENGIMIIFKITSKLYLTFQVNYCIIRRHCSKVSNCVILQITVTLETFIKANTGIIVCATLLGWLKDLALCLVLHSVLGEQQGRSSKVLSKGPCLRPPHCSGLTLPSLPAESESEPWGFSKSFIQNHTSLFTSPGKKKKSILTL